MPRFLQGLTGFTRVLGAKSRRGIAMAVRNLFLHKLRSFLSVLGIIIGTAAVIVLMAFGEGSMQAAIQDIHKQGANNIHVYSVKPPDDSQAQGGGRSSFRRAKYGLTLDDRRRFQETLKPMVVATLCMRTFPAEVQSVTGAQKYSKTRVVATEPRYAEIYKLGDQIAMGRFLSEQDEKQLANVAVLGSEVAAELFPGEDPLTKRIKLKDRAFEVIGVLKDRMPSSSTAEVEKFNGDVYIPLESWRERLGQLVITRGSGTFAAEEVVLSQITLTVDDSGDTDEVRQRVHRTADIVRAQLQQYHDKADVDIRVPLDRLKEAERTRDRYRILLFFIAGISLLVGGIGIMNIMLATVTERTREIGIRRALGAKRSDITLQFLTEAVVQTTLGGLAGVAIGFFLMFAIPMVHQLWQEHVLDMAHAQIQKLPVQVHVPSIFLAFFVAVTVGVLFGWYPSRRAAHLDPIEALRHE